MHMKYTSIRPWLVLDMIVFVLINIVLIRVLNPHFEILSYITPIRLIVFGLAVYRAANIISNEYVTSPIRAPFVHEVMVEDKLVEEPREHGFRGFFGSLIYCPSCTGVWVAMIFTYWYLFHPAAASIIMLLLALSGLERFFAYTFGRIKRA